MWRPIERRSQKIHQRISKIGRHSLLRSTLRVLLIVGLIRRRTCCRAFLLLHQSSVAAERNAENESNNFVGRISHGGDQIRRQKISIFVDEIFGIVTNFPGEVTDNELLWICC
jgi:hypothetical protein